VKRSLAVAPWAKAFTKTAPARNEFQATGYH